MAQGTRYSPHQTPYESNYASYEDHYAGSPDLDAFSSQLRSPHPVRALARREEYLPEDSVPLFLAGTEEDILPSRFARPAKSHSRLLKTGALAIAALVATFVAVKNPFTVFANATASLMGVSDAGSTPTPAPAQPAAPRTTMAAASAIAPVMAPALAAATPSQLPSRDEIALALKTAHQGQPSVETQPPAAAAVPAVATPPVRQLDADALATLMARAKTLLATGDIPSARLLLERAAEAQEASAALLLAQTYDPTVLGTQDIRNITPDPAQARGWYQRAAQLGSADAQRRLSQLQ